MPIIKSAKKSLRQSKKRQSKNQSQKIGLRKDIKTLVSTITSGDGAKAKELLPTIYKKIDKATKRGLLKKNTAARRKSGLQRKVNKIL